MSSTGSRAPENSFASTNDASRGMQLLEWANMRTATRKPQPAKRFMAAIDELYESSLALGEFFGAQGYDAQRCAELMEQVRDILRCAYAVSAIDFAKAMRRAGKKN